MRKAHKGQRRKVEREVSRGHSRCGMTEGPNLSRVVSHACSLRVLGRSSDESREPAVNTGRTSSPEGDPGVHRTTGDTTNETSSLLLPSPWMVGSTGTAVCGTARTVVWEGAGGFRLPTRWGWVQRWMADGEAELFTALAVHCMALRGNAARIPQRLPAQQAPAPHHRT